MHGRLCLHGEGGCSITAENPLVLDCPMCEGAGCRFCEGGQFAICRCPHEEVSPELIGDMQFVAEAIEGRYPYANLIDNSHLFMQVVSFARHEKRMWDDA